MEREEKRGKRNEVKVKGENINVLKGRKETNETKEKKRENGKIFYVMKILKQLEGERIRRRKMSMLQENMLMAGE